jgi:ABC-2 type transport system ATP-binding protein
MKLSYVGLSILKSIFTFCGPFGVAAIISPQKQRKGGLFIRFVCSNGIYHFPDPSTTTLINTPLSNPLMPEKKEDLAKQIIVVSSLTKKFNSLTAVDNISFSVKHGEIFAFLGPNGAGKTTTIKMLTTLLKPTSGSLQINGYDVLKDQDNVRKSFGIVFQDQSLDNELTAFENMEFHGVLYGVPKALRRQRIEQLLKFVGLWDRKDSLVKTYSGGMRRRLEIARGLVHHPKVLFLDEPTLGLDPQTRNNIWDHILGLNKEEGMTIFFTTHYIEEAEKVASRVAVIDQGKIISMGTSAKLKKDTKTKTLEDAFLKLTGKSIREEASSGKEEMRMARRMWGR